MKGRILSHQRHPKPQVSSQVLIHTRLLPHPLLLPQSRPPRYPTRAPTPRPLRPHPPCLLRRPIRIQQPGLVPLRRRGHRSRQEQNGGRSRPSDL